MACGCGSNRATSKSSTSFDGAITRSEATWRFAVTGSWCAARSRSAGGPTLACQRRWTNRPKRRTILSPTTRREGGKRRPRVSWPAALRSVRGWLEPYVMLGRYWKAFSGMPPPPELRALLEWVFAGRGLLGVPRRGNPGPHDFAVLGGPSPRARDRVVLLVDRVLQAVDLRLGERQRVHERVGHGVLLPQALAHNR